MILSNRFVYTCFRLSLKFFGASRVPLRFYSNPPNDAAAAEQEEALQVEAEPEVSQSASASVEEQQQQQQAAPVEEQQQQQAAAAGEEQSLGSAAGSTVTPAKISASEQLAQSVECDTMQEAPEPVQRMVDLEHVRSKINELDQRKLRHQEYVEMLKQLIVKPANVTPEQKLPFKQPTSIVGNLRQVLRSCMNVEEVLKVTEDPQQLASELIKLSSELTTEKRKNDVVLESYMELKREMSSSNNSGSNN